MNLPLHEWLCWPSCHVQTCRRTVIRSQSNAEYHVLRRYRTNLVRFGSVRVTLSIVIRNRLNRVNLLTAERGQCWFSCCTLSVRYNHCPTNMMCVHRLSDHMTDIPSNQYRYVPPSQCTLSFVVLYWSTYSKAGPLTTPDYPNDSPTHDTTLHSATDSPTNRYAVFQITNNNMQM